jgi:hypothetical protein
LRTAIEGVLGPYNPILYRVFFWDVDHYIELPNMPDDCDLAGRAFWVLTRFGAQVTVSGLDCYANRGAGGVRVIPLKPGWNMVSLPYENGVQVSKNWATVNVTSDGAAWTGAGPVTTSPSLIDPNLFDFVGGTYVSASVMVAGRGYWVDNLTSGYIYLLVDTVIFKSGTGTAPSFSALAAGTPTPPGPPGSGLPDGSSSKRRSCALLGPELVVIMVFILKFRRLGSRDRVSAQG